MPNKIKIELTLEEAEVAEKALRYSWALPDGTACRVWKKFFAAIDEAKKPEGRP